MKKEGPNFEDFNRIREWHDAGKDAAEISDLLKIKEEPIQIYLDSLDQDDEPEEEDDED